MNLTPEQIAALQRNLTDPIFQSDIKSEEEFATEGWRSFYAMFFQLQHQGAPNELLERVVEINLLYQELLLKLADIKQCFLKGNSR